MSKVFGVGDYDRERGLTEEQLVTLGKNIAIVQMRIDAQETALLEELLGERASREVDRSVHAVDQRQEPREVGRQVELDQLDDHAIGCGYIGEADGAGASRLGMRPDPDLTEASKHSIEVGRLNTKVGHAKPRAKCPVPGFRRLHWSHARRELTDHQELPAEKHAVVLATLARRNRSQVLSAEAGLVEPNRGPRVGGMNVNVVDGGDHQASTVARASALFQAGRLTPQGAAA